MPIPSKLDVAMITVSRAALVFVGIVAVASCGSSPASSGAGATGAGGGGSGAGGSASGAGGATDDSCVRSYPTAPPGATTILYVASDCPAAGAVGTLPHPFQHIQDGVNAAMAGTVVLVAQGVYDENVSVMKPVAVIGSSSDTDSTQAGAVLNAPMPVAVAVGPGADGTLIQGLKILHPISVGISIRGVSATVKASVVDGALPDQAGKFGIGVLVADGGSASVGSSDVSNCARNGVIVDGSTAQLTDNSISGNGQAGIRIQHALGANDVSGNSLDSNTEAGIIVLSSSSSIIGNKITDTKADPTTTIGDAIVVVSPSSDPAAGPVDSQIMGNTISGSARVGVLCAEGCLGSVVGNEIAANGFLSGFGAGIWLQTQAGGAHGIDVMGNMIHGNKFVGIGMTSGSRSTIMGNAAIDATVSGSVTTSGGGSAKIGDGIGVFLGSAATVQGNTMAGNQRFGIILDGPLTTGTTVASNTISGSGSFGAVVQDLASGMIDVSANTYSANVDGNSTTAPVGMTLFQVKKDEFAAK